MAKGKRKDSPYFCAFKQDSKGAYDIGSGRDRVLYSAFWINRPESKKEELVMLAVGLTRGHEIYGKTGIAPHQIEVMKRGLETTIIVYTVFSDKNCP